MRNPPPGFCNVGCQPGCDRERAGSDCSSPISTSATMRPPTGPGAALRHQLGLLQHVVEERRRDRADAEALSSARSWQRAPARPCACAIALPRRQLPRQVSQQRPLRQRGRRSWLAIAPSGRWKAASRASCRFACSADLAVAEVEERLPADEAARRARAAAEIDRIAPALAAKGRR